MSMLSQGDYFLKDSHRKIALSCFIEALTNSENLQRLYAERDQFRDTAKYEAFLILKASQIEFALKPFLADGIAETIQSLSLGSFGDELAGVFALRPNSNIWPQLVQSTQKTTYEDFVADLDYGFHLDTPKTLPLPEPLIVFPELEIPEAGGKHLRIRIHQQVPTATLRYALEVDVSDWRTPGLKAHKTAIKSALNAAAAKTKEIFSAYLVLKDVVAWLNQIKTYQELIAGFPVAASIDQLKPKNFGQDAPAAPTVLKNL